MIGPAPPRVVVTGGSGFIGTNLLNLLAERGSEVTSLDFAPPRQASHRSYWKACDLLDRDAVAEILRRAQPTHLVHLGARTDLAGRSLGDYATNTDGTQILIAECAKLDQLPRVVVASSRMVCPIGYQPRSEDDYCPPNAYGESKVQTEKIVRRSEYTGIWTIIRPTSIWGPWFDVPYRDFFLSVMGGRYRHPAGIAIHKSFGYVENAVAQIAGLLEADGKQIDGRVFYLADYEPIEVRNFAERIRIASGARGVGEVPIGVLRAVAGAGDLLQRAGWRRVPLTSFRLANLLTDMVHDLTPIAEVLPVLPTSLDDGIARTVAWLVGSGGVSVR